MNFQNVGQLMIKLWSVNNEEMPIFSVARNIVLIQDNINNYLIP
jgi:hypothetical protein